MDALLDGYRRICGEGLGNVRNGCLVIEAVINVLMKFLFYLRKPYQRINHFPGMHEICRKDRLARNLARLSRLFPKDANFFPRTWVLPSEWADFQMAHRSSRRRQCYIAKPDHGCQGKGSVGSILFCSHGSTRSRISTMFRQLVVPLSHQNGL